MNDEQFRTLLSGLRSGDSQAIQEFVSTFEPYIRRTLRFRIAHSGLGRATDSVDICQSVLGTFLIRLAAGDFEFASDQDLRAMLRDMATKKFLTMVRRETAARRDHRRTVSLDTVPDIAVDDGDSGFDYRKPLEEFQRQLTPKERTLFELRCQGLGWDEIDQRLSEPAATLRKRLSRATHRFAKDARWEKSDESSRPHHRPFRPQPSPWSVCRCCPDDPRHGP